MAKDSQTRFVSPKAWERIEHWSRRKPVFALMGEFSAGKSTLMNFLLRKRALPTQVTATQLPPIWFSWGNQSAYVKRHDGSTQDISLDELETVGVNDAQFVRIFLEADILEAVDLIDTPGISDPKISSDVWQRAVGQANGVLWCTHATQAWRETERATWVALPERLQSNSLLLVTRADALGAKDRQKVLRRVNREAGHLFNRSILFSARDAITARDKTGDAELWARSGGGKMIDSFLEITEQIMDTRADHLARYQIDKGLSDSPKIQPLRPERKPEVSETDQGTKEAEPLKLVNPVADTPEDEGTDSAVVTSFPVRPARVERRSDDTERARIDAEEAERLRAEMVPSKESTPVDQDTDDEELRAFFRDTSNDPLDLTSLAADATDFDEFELIDEFEAEEEIDEDIAAEGDDPDKLEAEETDKSDDVLTSLSSALAEAPEATEDQPAPDEEPKDRSIEVSVSSITALMAEQPGGDAEEYEPEPETNGIVEIRVDSQPDAADLETLAEGSAGAPLSAWAMWQEVVKDDELPDDVEGLKSVFQAFLAEFDQIVSEHGAQQTKEALRSIPKTSENSGAEWHVL